MFCPKAFCPKCKHHIGLTPLHWPQVDVGKGQCQEKFFMVGRSVGRRGVRRQRALSDSRRRTNGSFYFFLEPPSENRKNAQKCSKIVVTSGHFGALSILFFSLEYILTLPPHATYVIVNGLGWFQSNEHLQIL